MSETGKYLASGAYFGAVAGRQQGNGLILSEVRHAAPRRLPEHSHEQAFFCVVLEGGYTERVGRRRERYEPLSVLFHAPELSHEDEIGRGGGRFFSVELGRAWMERLREIVGVPEVAADPGIGELAWLAARLFREFRQPNAGSPLAVEGLVLEMLAVAARASGEVRQRPPWMGRAIELLESEHAQEVTVAGIAAAVGVHPVHFTRSFRRWQGLSASEYVLRLRVRSACRRLLADGEVGLAEVATAAGFADQSHLTRMFRRVTGMTPGGFRAAVRAGNEPPVPLLKPGQ